MSEIELDYEMAEEPSPDIIEPSHTEGNEINKSGTNEVPFNEQSEMASPEIIEVSQTEENDIEIIGTYKVRNSSELDEMHNAEIVEVPQIEEDEVQILKVKISYKSNDTNSDMEEGEIKEPDDDDCNVDNAMICKYFRRGMCFLGKNCRFLHIGVSSYKMFESTISNPPNLADNAPSLAVIPPCLTVNPACLVMNPMLKLPVYHCPVEFEEPTEEPPDSWDTGLREAKKLLLRAKLKKETDLDFEEKQLYQDLNDGEIIKNNKVSHKRKLDLPDKQKKQEETPESWSYRKNSELGKKPLKTFPKKRSGSPKNMKSTTRNRSNSWSPVPSLHRQSVSPNSSSPPTSSSCSECKASYHSHRSKNNYQKTKSKLERVFSRTFYSPETSRSRKLTISRNTYSSYPRRRSLSRSSFVKRFIYRSYSKSPSPSKKEYSKNHHERDFSNKPLHKRPTPPPPETRRKHGTLYPNKERNSSSFSKLSLQNYVTELESCSSNMTVSSPKCTSASDENKSAKPSKSPAMVSRKMDGEVGNMKRKREDKSSHRLKERLNMVSKSTNRSENECPEVTKKNIDKEKKKAIVSRGMSNEVGNMKHKREDGSSHDVKERQNIVPKSTNASECPSEITKKNIDKEEKSLKPIENGITVSKSNRKQSSCSSSSEDELSADKLELLRYISCKNRKPEPREKKSFNNVKIAKPSPKPIPEHPPPKIVNGYGSEKESYPVKLVEGPGSKEESLDSKTPTKQLNVHDRAVNGKNHVTKESIDTPRTGSSLSKNPGEAVEDNSSPTKKFESHPNKETIPKLTDKDDVVQSKEFHNSKKSRKRRSSESSSDERQFSNCELELLKYVSIGNPFMSADIQKQKRKNPSFLTTKKTQQKKSTSESVASRRSSHNSAERKKTGTIEISRREQLMKQLEAVELAIAKKKKLAKLEFANKRRKSLLID